MNGVGTFGRYRMPNMPYLREIYNLIISSRQFQNALSRQIIQQHPQQMSHQNDDSDFDMDEEM